MGNSFVGVVATDYTWWWIALLVAIILAVIVAIAIWLFCGQKATKRAVKPPVEETVPLMAPQLVQPHMVQLAAPNLSMVVQPQPLMHQVQPGMVMQHPHM